MTMTLNMSSLCALFHPLLQLQLQLHHNDKLRLKKFSDLCCLSNKNGHVAPLRGPVSPLPAPRARKFVSATTAATIDAVTSSVLAADLPPKPVNPSVLLLTSAVLFFAFWITNFMVPEYISDYLQLDVAEELKNPNNDAEDTSDDSPIYTQPSRSRRDFKLDDNEDDDALP